MWAVLAVDADGHKINFDFDLRICEYFVCALGFIFTDNGNKFQTNQSSRYLYL